MWRELLEAFPDRLVIGTDVNNGRFVDSSPVVETFRRLVLARLDRSTAEAIAHRNAWRLTSGREWRD